YGASLYQNWQQQKFHVDDVKVANVKSTLTTQAAVPTNASFGSMIGLPSAFTNTPYRGDGYSVVVIDTGIDYNNPSLGAGFGAGNYTTNPYTFVDDEFTALKNNGVFVAVAAGNSFYSLNSAPGLDFPAVSPLVVSVGAVYDGNFGAVAWASGARDNTTAVDR